MKTKINYQITIGYKAIISISVKADTEEEAKRLALEKMKLVRGRIARSVILEDDNYKVDGILNMDETWNQF